MSKFEKYDGTLYERAKDNDRAVDVQWVKENESTEKYYYSGIGPNSNLTDANQIAEEIKRLQDELTKLASEIGKFPDELHDTFETPITDEKKDKEIAIMEAAKLGHKTSSETQNSKPIEHLEDVMAEVLRSLDDYEHRGR